MNIESPATKLSAFLLPWRQTRLVSQVGGEVARQCHADFWQCVGSRVVGMEVAEIKGYVRAVADGFIVAEVDQVLNRRRLSTAVRSQVVASAVHQLINLTVRDALRHGSPANVRPLAA